MTPTGRLSAQVWCKRIALGLVFAINIANWIVRIVVGTRQIYFVLVIALSVVPYLVYLHWLSPRLSRPADGGER